MASITNSIATNTSLNNVEHSEPKETDHLTADIDNQESNPNNNDRNDSEPSSEISFTKKLAKFRSNITVEPMMVLFITCVMISNMSNQNLFLEKACRVNLNFSKEVCDALERRDTENYKLYEEEVQKLTARVSAWKTVITTVIPCMMILFIGTYSDKTGRRKMFMIIPMIGEIMSQLSNFVHVYFFYELRIEYLALTEGIFPALGGGFCVMFLGVFSYISDITDAESRTFRMGMVNFCMSFGFPLGMSLSGILLKMFGFYVVYGITVFALGINIIYGLFILKDPPRQKPVTTEKVKFLDFSNVRQTLSVMCSGTSARNIRMWILLTTICMLFGPLYGEITILYLSTRFRFNWEAVSFSIYLTYNFLIHSIGTIFSIVVLSKILKWHDSLLGIISTVSKMGGAIVAALAQTGQQFYIGPVIEIMNGTSMLALRSMMSKMVSSDEQGKLNSVVGLAEQMMPIIYAPIYTKVYSLTLNIFPGTIFFLSGALQIIPALTFIYIFIEYRRTRNRSSTTHH